MPKKKGEPMGKQLNIRVPIATYDRLERTAHALGIDYSGLVRMIVNEKLPEYEERARRTQEQPPQQPRPQK